MKRSPASIDGGTMMASTATPSADLLRTRDAIALPTNPAAPIEAHADRSDSYPIVVTSSVDGAIAAVAELVGNAGVALITDDVVMDLHGGSFLDGLHEIGIEPQVAAIAAGEGSKSLDQAVALWHWLADGTLGRRDVVVTFGGGVVNDLGGWVASAYMRGMRYVNVPTTLVGQVDAGIGGKLAVNHRTAKNLIGGFHQPTGVVACIAYLRTLDVRHVRAGIAETIKKALIASPEYWEFIESHAEALQAKDPDALERLVAAAGAIKAELIGRDPYENDSRRTLGFGHALAHPLETVTGYGPVLHGEAVSFGMVVEARMSAARGWLPAADLDRIVALLCRMSLPTEACDLPVEVDGTALLAATEKVRLARGGSLRWVLPLGVGDTVIVDDVRPEELVAALRASGVSALAR